MTHHALLFTIAAIGASEAAYLVRKRMQGRRPVCPLGETCHVVLESRYNKLLGIHNDILGLLFYIALGVLTAFLVLERDQVALWMLGARFLIWAGTAMSLILLFIQGRLIKQWCFWCVTSAITIFIMAIIIGITDLAL